MYGGILIAIICTTSNVKHAIHCCETVG